MEFFEHFFNFCNNRITAFYLTNIFFNDRISLCFRITRQYIFCLLYTSEIGDFSAFSKPKQLFAYFGLDPAVKQSGKFEGTKVQMSKRGSAIARRVIHTLTLQSISISRNGEAKNPVLREYYLKKCDSKPKLVAMGAVSHKVCNMIFAILRDNKSFEIITPQEHIKQYNASKCDMAA